VFADDAKRRFIIVQGTLDADLPPRHSEFATATIPRAELLKLEEGTHLALYTHVDADQAQRRVIEFLMAHAPWRRPSLASRGQLLVRLEQASNKGRT
jgi:hypothetical protein